MDIDYDLHGLAGVRVVGAGPREAAAVDRQLGPIRAPLTREPDIVVRFVDQLEVRGRVRLLGVDDAGFTDDAFLILRSKHKAKARVQLPMDAIGGPCEIVCERGLPAVPLLIATLNLTVLANGALPLHAAAFEHEGRGVVVTGWSKGGKTEAVLAFVSRGARFVGDEWVYLAPDGRVHGIPEPMRVWDWYLRQLPDLQRQVSRGDRARLAALRATTNAARGRRGRRVAAFLSRQQHVDIAPEQLFGDVALTTTFDRLVLVASWEDADTAARPIEPTEVADRMAFSLQYERAPLTAAYEQFRFAFPDRRNALIDGAAERERELLAQLLDGKVTYAVEHPYPANLDRLYEVMAPVL